VRPPLLDHVLLEFAATVPSRYKVHGRTKKWMLRKVAERRLPPEILQRGKRGFSVPLSQWMRQQLKPMIEAQLSPARLQQLGIFSPTYVRGLLDEHFSGRADHENKIWSLFVFSLWHRTFIENSVMLAQAVAH
jgi:asparagine synthase (glutamine-hydrolysing)